jgi:hypothetical protein
MILRIYTIISSMCLGQHVRGDFLDAMGLDWIGLGIFFGSFFSNEPGIWSHGHDPSRYIYIYIYIYIYLL